MSAKKILFLTVLYKNKCSESDTVVSLLPQLRKHSLLIWDNSPNIDETYDSFLSDDSLNVDYRFCPQNLPLSEIYQQTIYQAHKEEYTHLVLLDQDSVLNKDFVLKLNNALNINPDSVIIPEVYVEDLLVSPNHSWKWFGWKINGNSINVSLVSAINSGVCIPLSEFILSEFSYPKGLKNYGTDVYLFEHVRRNNINTVLINSRIQHDLTFHKSNPDNDSYFRSYVEHMKAMGIIFSSSMLERIGFLSYRVCHCLKVAIMRKDFRYISWWFNG